MPRRCLLPMLIAAICASPLSALDVDNPPRGVFSDEWYAVYIQNQKSGHTHITMERLTRDDGRDVIRTSLDMTIEMRRSGQVISVSMKQSSTEGLEGRPIAFEHSLKLGNLPGPTTKGVVRDGKVMITTSQFGQEGQDTVYDLPEGAMMSWGVFRETMRRGLEPGLSYELAMYEPTISPKELIPVTMEIEKRETLDLFGRQVDTIKTIQRMRLPGSLAVAGTLESISWITDAGETLKLTMPVMDLNIEILACPRAAALAPNDPAEMMMDMLIQVDQKIDRSAAALSYILSKNSKAGKARLGALPTTSMQHVDEVGADRIRFTVHRRDREWAAGTESLSPEEKERYLAPTSMVNYKDPKVAELAKQAAGDEKDPEKIARKLTIFVHDFVKTKDLSIGFATASEVARSRQGDCTEHGILLAALGRAHGIPSRVVAGVVYAPQFGGRKGVFVGHMWTQFWIGGRWIDIDPALGQFEPDATHIAMSLSDAGDSSIGDLCSALWLNLGKFDLTVVPTPAATQPGQ